MERDALEQEIVRISLRHSVLCRFTAYVAIDEHTAVTDGAAPHGVTQLVEPPSGWISLGERALPAQATPGAVGGASRAPRGARAMGRRRATGMPRPGGAFDGVSGQSASSSVDPSAPEFPAAAPTAAAAPSPAASMPAPPLPQPAMRSLLAHGSAPLDDEQRVARVWAVAREQSATEARMLREWADEPAFRRRDLLEDLASRLDALVLHVQRAAKGSAEILRQLISVLRDETVSLDERWNKALVLLDRFATEPEQQEKPQPSAERRAFWKRG
jgi:Ca-activated chloride channel family protein